MSHYCFFDVREVTDHAKVERYLVGVFATVAQYGGRYLVLGGKSDVVEGDWQPTYPVIVEFADGEQARRWYSSPEYEPLKALRLAGTRTNAVFIEGATPQSTEAAARASAAGALKIPGRDLRRSVRPRIVPAVGPRPRRRGADRNRRPCARRGLRDRRAGARGARSGRRARHGGRPGPQSPTCSRSPAERARASTGGKAAPSRFLSQTAASTHPSVSSD